MKKQFKNMILYTLGHSVSALGSIIYSFAIGLYVLNTTGSGLKFAITLLVSFLPSMLMTPFAGVFADRFDKKKIVVSMDMLNGLLFIAFFVFIFTFEMSILSVYITAFLTNVITAFFSIAFEAAKPQLVYKEHLQKLNAISQLIHAGTAIVGPILGGFVYVLMDIKTFILFNGLSFLLSAVTEMFIDFKFAGDTEVSKEPLKFKQVLGSLNEGFHYIINQKVIMSSYVFFVGINVLMSLAVQVPLPYILNNHLNIGAKAYGIIFSFLPIGMIAGALIVGLVTKNINSKKLFIIISFAAGILTIVMGLPYFIPGLTGTKVMIYIFFAALLFAFGMMISLIDVPFSTLIQVETDEKFLGRVWGILIPMIKVINPLGYILAGFLLEFVNPYLIPLISGAIFTILLLIKTVTTQEETLKKAA
ncbi:MAG: MFS transporter [Clostridiales bacterium]|nr:MFS transporter [Clostridiales bacterium]